MKRLRSDVSTTASGIIQKYGVDAVRKALDQFKQKRQLGLGGDTTEEEEYFDVLPAAGISVALPGIQTNEGKRIAKNIATRVASGQTLLQEVPRKYQSYVQGEVKGAMPMTRYMNETAPKVALGALAVPGAVIGAAELAPLVANELGTYGGVYGRFARTMLRDLPAFEVVDRAPTLFGEDRFTTQGGNILEKGYRYVVPDGIFEDTTAPIVNTAGQFASGLIPGVAGDMLMRTGSRAVLGGLSKWDNMFKIAPDDLRDAPLTRKVGTESERIQEEPIYFAGRSTLDKVPAPTIEDVSADNSENLIQMAEDLAAYKKAMVEAVRGGDDDVLAKASELSANNLAAPAAYQIQDLGGGYMLKPLMPGNPLEKQIGKSGTVNVNNIRSLISKSSKVEQAVVDKVLASEEFAGKKSIDYNKFRKAVQDELITYDRTPDTRWEDYGMDRLRISTVDTYRNWRFWKALHLEKRKNPNTGLWEYYDESGNLVPLDKARELFLKYALEQGYADAAPSTFTFSSPRVPKGSSKHYNHNTLGHSRTYTTADEPDVLHVMESQSDWAQTKAPIIGSATSVSRGVNGNTDIILDANGVYRRVAIDEGIPEYEFFHTIGDDGLTHYFRFADQSRKEFPLEQAQYLLDNYTSRQIQENLRYAAEKGQTKMRYPTRETAAKVEGYTKKQRLFDEVGNDVTDNEELLYTYGEETEAKIAVIKDAIRRYENTIDHIINSPDSYSENVARAGIEKYQEKLEVAREQLSELYKNERVYRPGITKKDVWIAGGDYKEAETILRKYDAFPKQYKKLFKDANVRAVTDSKGNTWYEVDVPNDYLRQEWPYAEGGQLSSVGSPLSYEGASVGFLQMYDPKQVMWSPASDVPDHNEQKNTSQPFDLDTMKLRQRFLESDFNDKAVSRKGARGAFQIMPITLKGYLEAGGEEGDLMDPVYNEKVRDWAWNRYYNLGLVTKNNPTEQVRIAKALAAYNWGEGNLGRYLTDKKKQGVDIYNTLDWLPDLPTETRNYVRFLLLNEDINSRKSNARFEKMRKELNFDKGGMIKRLLATYDVTTLKEALSKMRG